MKYFKVLFILTILISTTAGLCAQTKAMTYNIRLDNPDDGDNWWDHRKGEVVELLQYYNPDFIGMQEVLPRQLTYVDAHLETHSFIGHERDGKGSNSEGAPILYNTSKYELIEEDLFWLSETPSEMSRGWDAALNRIAVYGKFKNKKSGETIHVLNAHFDHKGVIARLKSAELLVSTVREKNLGDEKVIVMGDLNSAPESAPIMALNAALTDSYSSTDYPVYGPVGTFTGFDTVKPASRRIDYIFTMNIDVKSYRCIDDRRKNNLQVSDHYAVMIEF